MTGRSCWQEDKGTGSENRPGVKLLDLLEDYPGWTLDAEGRLWSVEEYVRQYALHAATGDRGPEVAAHPSIDTGALTLMEMDAVGRPGNPLGILFQPGRRW